MAFENTGYSRAQTLRVDKTIGGVSETGYPKDYAIRTAFTWDAVNYPSLSSLQFQELSLTDYNLRLAAFYLYVADEEETDIEAVTVNPAREENLGICPLPGKEIYWDSVDNLVEFPTGTLGADGITTEVLSIVIYYTLSVYVASQTGTNQGYNVAVIDYSIDGGATWVPAAQISASIPGDVAEESDTQTTNGYFTINGIATASNVMVRGRYEYDTSTVEKGGTVTAKLHSASLDVGTAYVICDDTYTSTELTAALSCSI